MHQGRVHITVPASTSNLGSGFDTLGLALSLRMSVSADFNTDAVRIRYSGEGAARIPTDERNLVYRSYAYGCQQLGQAPRLVTLDIHNPIPLERGLGSSGAAIAAGLVLADVACGYSAGDQLLQWGTELEGHPENVSASLNGGFTINCLHDGRVISVKTEPPPDLRAVALIPEVVIPTEEARRILPEQIPRQSAIFNMQRVALWAIALQKGELHLLRAASEDRLHQPYRKRFIPGFDALIEAAYAAGASAAFLSGSGSTILALCGRESAEAVQSAMAGVASVHDLVFQTRILELETEGAQVSANECGSEC